MKRVGLLAVLALAVLAPACTRNSAPGNDREAQLDPPPGAAQVTAAGTAITGVATRLLKPEIMTDADLGNVADMAESCVFRMTRVGLPVLVYGPQALVKLNGKLVQLPTAGIGRYAADGVAVTVRPLDDAAGDGGPFPAEFVLSFPGGAHVLGFHGFAAC